jgi:hypothetical protein
MFIERIAALLMLSGLSVLPMPTLAHESDGGEKPAPAQDFSESALRFSRKSRYLRMPRFRFAMQ